MIDIDPTSSGLPGIAQLRDIVGVVMTVGLFLSVLALIISAIVWGFGANSSNPHLASRGKTVRCRDPVRSGGHADQLLLDRRPGRELRRVISHQRTRRIGGSLPPQSGTGLAPRQPKGHLALRADGPTPQAAWGFARR